VLFRGFLFVSLVIAGLFFLLRCEFFLAFAGASGAFHCFFLFFFAFELLEQRSQGVSGLWMQSLATGHGTSPLVRQPLNPMTYVVLNTGLNRGLGPRTKQEDQPIPRDLGRLSCGIAAPGGPICRGAVSRGAYLRLGHQSRKRSMPSNYYSRHLRTMKTTVLIMVTLSWLDDGVTAQTSAPPAATAAARGRGQGKAAPPPIEAKPEELAKIKDKTAHIESLVTELKARQVARELVTDVEVYAHGGKMLLEYPDMFGNQAAIEHAFVTLDQGIERGQQLLANRPEWNQGKRQIHAYVSEIDGAVLPYGVTLPENYDPNQPTRLYVWLHGRQNNTTETEFIYGFLNRKGPGNPPVADQGQIQLDCFGR
jgi:hypothetical protein